MHRYEELEKLYYKRKFLKIFFIFLIFLLISVLVFLVIHNQQNKKNIKTEEKNITKKQFKAVTEKNNSKMHLNNIKKIIKKEKIKEKNKKKDKKFATINFKVPVIDLNLSKKKDLNKTQNPSKKITVKKVIVKEFHKKNKKPVIIEENLNVNDLIKNFNNNPSFDLAIQISEYYLNNNKLDMAKLWALKANSINPERYESWKIFAIILIKRNKKTKAKEVLQTYLNNYGQNEEIEELLRSLDE